MYTNLSNTRIIRTRYSLMNDYNSSVIIDDSTTVEPGLSTEVSDLFKHLDESGEVHNYEYTNDAAVNVFGSEFSENETTYQGAYERWEYGDAVAEAQRTQQENVVSEASAASVQNSETENSSDA